MNYFLNLSVLLFLSLSTKVSACTLIFESEEILIMVDTTVYFNVIDKNYKEKRRSEIRTEILSRIYNNNCDKIKMDGMYLNACALTIDSKKTVYENLCLTGNEIYDLIEDGKTKIAYKGSLKEIINFKTKKIGSKKSGRIKKLYIDKLSGKVFLERMIYSRTCVLPDLEKNNRLIKRKK